MKRPDLVLAGAVVLCLPMVPALLSGSIPTATALQRFLLALVVAWVAGRLISAVVGRYNREAQRAELLAQLHKAQGALADRDAAAPAPLETARPDQIIRPS